MTQIVAVSRQHHADKRWKRFTNYSFTAKDAVAPLVIQELPRACMTMPIGFVEAGDGFQLVALQSLYSGRNVWLRPDGRWFGPYVPALYRSYPFVLAKTDEDKRVLCFHEDSGLVSDTEGEPFFDKEGNLSKPTQDVMRFLERLVASTSHTAGLVAMLAGHNLIQPWNIQIKADNGDQTTKGLFRIDEAAFNALPIDTLETLHKAGALPLVYCQLLSMQNIRRLIQLINRQLQADSPNTPQDQPESDLDLEFLKDESNIRFH